MQSLDDLRKHLSGKITVAAENLKTFIVDGSVINHMSDETTNRNFQIRYMAEIYIDNPKEPAAYIFLIVSEWMNERFPDRDIKNSIKFEADILKHDDVIIEITLDLHDDYKVSEGENGRVNIQAFRPDDCPELRGVCINHAPGEHIEPWP